MRRISLPPSSRRSQPPGPSALRSVVKVLTVSDAPDYEQPWQTRGAISSSGSGAVVQTNRGLRVLTNAHVVENQVFVEVRRYGNSTKYVAEVEGVGHECDLALLRVEQEEFYGGAEPLVCGPLPALGTRVKVLGYPIGGERLSVTEGVVSRIEVSPYAQTQRSLLAIQLDAAINSGSSGGPVFKDDRLIGVAFQSLEEGENISYAIAAPVVQHFLKDIEDGIFDGFPDLGITWQPLEAASHRKQLGLSAKGGGILVTGVVYQGSAWRKLREGDAILEIDGVPIARDGTVALRPGELVDLSYVVAQRQVGERMDAVIWRSGTQRRVRLHLTAPKRLVPEDRYDVRPSYFIYGGLVFVPLTRDYLKSWGDDWQHAAPHHLMALHDYGLRRRDRLEVVILMKVLADRANQGYHELENLVVTHVNGVKIRSLREVIQLIDAGKGAFTTIATAQGRQIVLDADLARQRHAAVLARYHVPSDRSDDLL